MLLAVVLGVSLHLTVMLTVDNKPLAHAAHGIILRSTTLSVLLFNSSSLSCHSKLAPEHVE